MVDLGCPDYMNYLLRRYNSDRETTDHKKQKRGPDSASSEVIEVSDYTKEALQLFKQKLSTYIETVNKNLASATEESIHFNFHEKSSDLYRKSMQTKHPDSSLFTMD
uniref:Uncharacterized protein n=1 Tax=Schistosoma japonicum TaxID=6182 RepID=C1LK08_SCHJA|nr:hypothetical protein [Schistosoma japonicum]